MRAIPAVGITSFASAGRKEYNENSGKLTNTMPSKANPRNTSSMACRSDDLTGMAIWLIVDPDSIESSSIMARSFPYASLPISYASCNFGLPLISPTCHTPPQNNVPFTTGFSKQSRNPIKLATIRSIIAVSSSAAVAIK